MGLSREKAVRRWVDEVVIADAFKPKRSYSTGNSNRSRVVVRGDESEFVMRYNARDIVLARIYRERGYVAINGDGIDRWGNAPGSQMQTMVREAIQNDVRTTSMVIPFEAVTGAGLDLGTAKLIHVMADGMVLQRHAVPPPPIEMIEDPSDETPRIVFQEGLDGEGERWFVYKRNWSRSNITYRDFETEELAEREQNGRGQGWQGILFREDSQQWEWHNRAHQLGESLFSAVSEDGRRHKWLSSFDRTEREPLYFLAQLPDGSGANTIEEATLSLAPSIVHAAQQEGKIVERQGDVFFIPTDLTDDQVYGMSVRRVRRECVMEPTASRDMRDWATPRRGEVRSLVPCPCNCGHDRWSSDTPRGRATLSIYGTAHTADEVAVTRDGRVYCRGTAHHDPPIIGEQRRPDHMDKRLGEKWHLAVRNTVPRRRTPRIETEEVTEEVTA